MNGEYYFLGIHLMWWTIWFGLAVSFFSFIKLSKKKIKINSLDSLKQRFSNGEIDIIAICPSTHSASSGHAGSGKNEQTLVFIEVKTRTSSQFGTPFEAITHWKLEAMERTAQFYKLLKPNLPDSIRLDAISVTLDSMNELDSIEHIENISGF